MSQTDMIVIKQSGQTESVRRDWMNERFYELPEEKQMIILNSAMEVFAKYDYKKASTDLIAAKAGVSKGLLFYYFHNKKELYFAVHEYAMKTVAEAVVDSKLMELTDFYEFITYATMKKMKVLKRHPYIMDFSIRSFYSEKEEISNDLQSTASQGITNTFDTYFAGIDFSKFKDDIEPRSIYRMLIWMIDGYLHELRMQGKMVSPEEIEKVLFSWVDLFKRSTYKEEFL